MKLDGDYIRDNFDRVLNGIRGAIDFLRKQLHIPTIKTLPYPLMLAPLSVYFAVGGSRMRITPANELGVLRRWFWRSCFSERYSGQSVRNARADVHEMHELREKSTSSLGEFSTGLGHHFFYAADFRISTARTATFVSMLAQRSPRSFISGNLVDLDRVLQRYNKAEFHHIFPKAYLESLSDLGTGRVNALANFCFLSRVDNNQIRALAPASYKSLMPSDKEVFDQVCDSALIVPETFTGNFHDFLFARTKVLLEFAYELCEESMPKNVLARLASYQDFIQNRVPRMRRNRPEGAGSAAQAELPLDA